MRTGRLALLPGLRLITLLFFLLSLPDYWRVRSTRLSRRRKVSRVGRHQACTVSWHEATRGRLKAEDDVEMMVHRMVRHRCWCELSVVLLLVTRWCG